jgi:hypothetical protein
MRKIMLGMSVFLFAAFVTSTIDVVAFSPPEDEIGRAGLALTVANGNLKKTRFLMEDSWIESDSSTTWADIFNTNIKLRGRARQCIRLTYSAEVGLDSFNPINFGHYSVRALVDGVEAQGGERTNTVRDANMATLITQTWWACNLKSRGMLHTIQIQGQTEDAVASAWFGKGTLTIDYKK